MLMLYSVGQDQYDKFYFERTAYTGPVRGGDGGYSPGASGTAGAGFLNAVLPMVDQARVTLAYCEGSDVC
jgi:hypothetical protein